MPVTVQGSLRSLRSRNGRFGQVDLFDLGHKGSGDDNQDTRVVVNAVHGVVFIVEDSLFDRNTFPAAAIEKNRIHVSFGALKVFVACGGDRTRFVLERSFYTASTLCSDASNTAGSVTGPLL